MTKKRGDLNHTIIELQRTSRDLYNKTAIARFHGEDALATQLQWASFVCSTALSAALGWLAAPDTKENHG